jgi:beta-glucosidase
VLSGGGSSQVTPPKGYGLVQTPPGLSPAASAWRSTYYLAGAPLAALRAAANGAVVTYLDGTDIAAAAAAAKAASIVVLFAVQPSAEGADAPALSLPDQQNALIKAIGTANPKTVVVLETGGPVLMPWLANVSSVLEAWYPGSSGADAIADILFGSQSPRGRLPVTFPADLAQTPRPAMAAPSSSGIPSIAYLEGSDIGYRWQARHHTRPLFPFGFGLSFTRFAYRDLVATGGATVHATAVVTNMGDREGTDVVQFYASPASGAWPKRLIGWSNVSLKAGETRSVAIDADPRLLATFDAATKHWAIAGGKIEVTVAHSSGDLGLSEATSLTARSLSPP